ncbi:MAG TPA: proton-conducting transporter membrane subunit [Lapillicoccus sp.]|nr:proton-conducting transporter membrane subunit [Lapillicoccus sp.]
MITFDVGTLLPALAPLLGSVVVLVVDVLDPRGQRVHYAIAFISLVLGMFGTFGALGAPTGDELRTLCLPDGGACLYGASALTTTLQLAALVAAAITLLLAWPSERVDETGRTAVTVSLLLAATGGAVGVAGARDLASWLITLELATLPVVALAALPGTRRALAGAVQLVTTSLVSFAMLALGAACWYAATGSPVIAAAPALAASSTPQRALLALAVVLVLGGIAFKLSLVPFHAWTPTTYAGSPLPVTVFLAAVSKVAALAALLVVISAVTQLGRSALVAVAVLAIASMTLGNLLALRQDDVVRLLAWSTVAQAGWVVVPLLSVSSFGSRAAAAYLLTYVVATLVAFTAVVMTVTAIGARRGRDLDAYRSLVRTNPWVGGALLLALTSLAGLPPGILGLIGKVVALRPVLAEGWWVVAVLAAANAVLGVAVYLRWVRILLQPADQATSAAGSPGGTARAATPTLTRVRAHPSHLVALGVGSAVLVLGSVQPELLLGLLG